jgi:hypothetical protein
LADWLELLAASQPGRPFGNAEIKKIFRLEAEERSGRQQMDTATGEVVEGEITEPELETVIAGVFEELQRRQGLLGSVYPFKVEEIRTGFLVTNRVTWESNQPVDDAVAVYMYCLIVSSLRLATLAVSEADEDRQHLNKRFHSDYMYGYLLQICACLAVGGYLGGRVISFGYPRPDGSNFLTAHQAVWQEYGAYLPVSIVPIGLPDDENDAGIDLVSWIDFPDKHGSKVLVFGQVASGRNWSGKSVLDRAKALKSWFAEPTYEYFLPLMVMPFNATDARKTINRGMGDIRPKVLVNEDRQFGLLLDRDRVAGTAALAFGFSPERQQQIDGFAKFVEVKDWVNAALETLAEE